VDDEDAIRQLILSMVEQYVTVSNVETAAKMMYIVLSTKEIDFSKFEVHPLILAIDNLRYCNNSYYYLINQMAACGEKLFKDGPILIERRLSFHTDDGAEAKRFAKIPDTVIFDMPGYFLFCSDFKLVYSLGDLDSKYLVLETFELLEKYRNGYPALHPLVALAYKMLEKKDFFMVTWHNRRGHFEFMSKILQASKSKSKC
jgi:hypothetical protein